MEAHLTQVGQVPVKMAELSSQPLVCKKIVAGGLFFGEGIRIVGYAEEAKSRNNGIELVVLPMARELLEFGEEVVKGVVSRIQLFDIASSVKLLHIFAIRQDHIKSTTRGLRNQAQHVVTAGVVFRHELDVVGLFEFTNDIGLCVTIPSKHRQFGRLRRGTDGQERRSQGCGTCHLQQTAATWSDQFSGHRVTPCWDHFLLLMGGSACTRQCGGFAELVCERRNNTLGAHIQKDIALFGGSFFW